jgi:hypothetical protein
LSARDVILNGDCVAPRFFGLIVLLAFAGLAAGCASGPRLQPTVPAGEVFVQMRTTNLAETMQEDEEREAAPRRVEVVMGGSADTLQAVHTSEVGGRCHARTDHLDVVDAVLALRCPDEEIIVVRTRRALVVRTRNGDDRWYDVASQAITPSARIVASAE